jgi:hypothetical protein
MSDQNTAIEGLVVKNVLKPTPMDVITKELGYTPEIATLLFNIVFYVSEVIKYILLPDVDVAEIYAELLPAFCGAPVSGNNWEILDRRLHAVVISKNRDTGQTLLTINLRTGKAKLPIILPIILQGDELWKNKDEVTSGIANDMAILYPPESVCEHVQKMSPSCKPGHTHRSVFHLGDDAAMKFKNFEKKADDSLVNKQETETLK